MKSDKPLKTLDLIAWALLTIGGLNWGLIGIFNINLVGAIFGDMTALSRLVFSLVGLAALYEIVQVRPIARRWDLHFRRHVTA